MIPDYDSIPMCCTRAYGTVLIRYSISVLPFVHWQLKTFVNKAIELLTNQSLQEALKPAKRKQGRPKLTWIQQIRNDLIECGVNPDNDFQNVFQLASNRKEWRKAIVQCALRRNSVGSEVGSVHQKIFQC